MMSAVSDPSRRRAALRLADNPRSQIDYVITLDFAVSEGARTPVAGPTGRFRLRYVPDRDILEPACTAAYVAELARQQWSGAAALAAAVFDDLNNQLVPRWLHLAMIDGDARIDLHDRQPHWDNPGLLACLPPS